MSDDNLPLDEDQFDEEVSKIAEMIKESISEIVKNHREEALETPPTVLYTMAVLNVYESVIAGAEEDEDMAAMLMVAVANAAESLREDALTFIDDLLDQEN